MKHEKTCTVLAAAVLAFLTAWGAIGCLISAFDLRVAFSGLTLLCGFSACLSALLLSFRHGGTVLLCLLALAGGYIYHDGTAARQLWQLLHHLSTIYNRAYGWGVLVLPEALAEITSFDWPLGILGAVIAIAVSRSICHQKSVWLPVLTTILPLCSCIVVTDTVPGELWLLMVLFCLILLMITSSVRQENALQGLRLTAAAALPVLLALIVLFSAIPQNSYVNQSEVFRENIITAAQNIPQLMETGMSQLAADFRGQPQKQVDLAGLGARISFTYPVMDVTAQQSGTLYLREQDYDQYDGLTWISGANRSEDFPLPGGDSETITIQTRNRKNFLFLPYYPQEELQLTGGLAENPEGSDTYTIRRTLLPDNWRQTAYRSSVQMTEALQQYLELPEITRKDAADFLNGLYSGGASNTEKADIIAALVTDSARYDLNSGKMPAGEPDFALWFLREGESGYCIHFATAATVLLRSAGVPARYVTGYLLEAEAGKTVTVTEENAHAWAEYYEPGLGVWIPLEATPAEVTAPAAPSRPAATESSESTEPVETTQTVTEPVTPATLPPEPTASEAGASLPTIPPVPEQSDPTGLISLLFLPVLALLLAAQRSVRLKVRRRQQRTGHPNRQALRRWQEAVRLSRLLRESPTEELIVLAQKAKFSQYELTQEELLQFDSFNRSCIRRLKERPWYLRLIYQYLYAVY